MESPRGGGLSWNGPGASGRSIDPGPAFRNGRSAVSTDREFEVVRRGGIRARELIRDAEPIYRAIEPELAQMEASESQSSTSPVNVR